MAEKKFVQVSLFQIAPNTHSVTNTNRIPSRVATYPARRNAARKKVFDSVSVVKNRAVKKGLMMMPLIR